MKDETQPRATNFAHRSTQFPPFGQFVNVAGFFDRKIVARGLVFRFSPKKLTVHRSSLRIIARFLLENLFRYIKRIRV